MPALVSSSKPAANRQRKPKPLPGIIREDSDDELGTEDLPWEYIYQSDINESSQLEDGNSRKRKRGAGQNTIVGARSGDFECKLGDTVLLKAEGSNEAWVGLICEFGDDDGEMSAYFMWFSSEKEIRNKQKKRTDFLPVSNTPSLV
jgi:origin recognition complex subunit 1